MICFTFSLIAYFNGFFLTMQSIAVPTARDATIIIVFVLSQFANGQVNNLVVF
jgi:hypothetical protein